MKANSSSIINNLLHAHVFEGAARCPDRLAFKCGAGSLSYAELSHKMCQLANVLRDGGVDEGDRVGVLMYRCLDCAIALYGVLTAGAVCVPLDPRAPAARLEFQIKDCDIKSLIISSGTVRSCRKFLKESKVDLELIVGAGDILDNRCIDWADVFLSETSTPILKDTRASSLAYILYTSGSTGTPKGIMHSHCSGLSYARLAAELYEITGADRVVNHSPIFFDISTFAFYAGPLAGATTIILPEAHIKMPASIVQILEEEKITIWYSVPLALRQLEPLLADRDLHDLRWILYAGEPFPVDALRKLMAHFPDVRFSNIYGPTELNQCTYFHFNANTELGQSVPLGRTWSETHALILDDHDCEVGPGETGELLIASPTLMLGYWNNEDLTSRKMLTWGDGAGRKKYYRTGDMVYRDDLDRLQFLGRKDHQVKIRGYRIELADISTNLRLHPNVLDALAFIEDHGQEQIISTAVIAKPQSGLSRSDVLEHLTKLIPGYAIPQRVYFMEEFPVTSTGKIDHRTLQSWAKRNDYDTAKTH